MTGIVRARYTLEFKQEAVRLVRGGQSLTSVSRGLGVSAQSIDNWVKADAVGGLKEAKGKTKVVYDKTVPLPLHPNTLPL